MVRLELCVEVRESEEEEDGEGEEVPERDRDEVIVEVNDTVEVGVEL